MPSFAPLQKNMFEFDVVQLLKQDHLDLQPPSVLIWQYEMSREDDTWKHLNTVEGRGKEREKMKKQLIGSSWNKTGLNRISIGDDTQKSLQKCSEILRSHFSSFHLSNLVMNLLILKLPSKPLLKYCYS